MTHDSRNEKLASRERNGRRPIEDDPAVCGLPGASACETDEFGLPIARPGRWLPDLDGEFELLDD
jgi:hypothetical protein